jgi:hypothetical protein
MKGSQADGEIRIKQQREHPQTVRGFGLISRRVAERDHQNRKPTVGTHLPDTGNPVAE